MSATVAGKELSFEGSHEQSGKSVKKFKSIRMTDME